MEAKLPGGYVVDIETVTRANTDQRRELYRDPQGLLSLQVQSIRPSGFIQTESHPNATQFVHVDRGIGRVIINGRAVALHERCALVIDPGAVHRIENPRSLPPPSATAPLLTRPDPPPL